MLNIVQCCPETPVLGEVPSKFCADHYEEVTSVKPVVVPPGIKIISCSNVNEVKLPDFEYDTLLVGCKKSGNVILRYVILRVQT